MNVKTLISAICIILAICLAIYFWGEWEKARFDAELPTPPAAEEQPGGHWHGDEWHADDAHENDTGETELIPSVDWQQYTELPELVKPENLGELDPEDPVAKAWAKLDYIVDNPFAWGGNADPRTVSLVAQLMPPPDGIASEAHADEIDILLYRLAELRDPRSIETLFAYQGPLLVSAHIEEALVSMGPAIVPYLISALDEALKAREGYNSASISTIAGYLSYICTQHPKELEGVAEHIALPKLEQLLAAGFLDDYHGPRVKEAIDWLTIGPQR